MLAKYLALCCMVYRFDFIIIILRDFYCYDFFANEETEAWESSVMY